MLDGDGRAQAFDRIDNRFFQLVEKLPRIDRERFHVTPLALSVERVKRQRRFPRSARPGDHDQSSPRNIDVDVPQVVLSRATDPDYAHPHSQAPGEEISKCHHAAKGRNQLRPGRYNPHDEHLACLRELDGLEIWAGDGHQIAHATHDPRNAKDALQPSVELLSLSELV